MSVTLGTPASLKLSAGGTGTTAGTQTAAATQAITGSGAKQLFLVRFNPDNPLPLRNSLVKRGVSIEDLTAKNIMLVYGAAGDVADAVTQAGDLLAVLPAAAKLSHATAEVIRGLSAAAARRRDHRRALAAAASRAPRLSGLQTWNSYGSVAAADATTGDSISPAPSTQQTTRAVTGGAPSPEERDQSQTQQQPQPTSGPDLYAFSIRLVSQAGPGELSSWPDELARALGRKPGSSDPCLPRVVELGAQSSSSAPVVHAYLCEEDIEGGLTWIAAQGQVVWSEPLLRAKKNNALAGWIMQTGNLTATQFFDPLTALRPYWNASIMGQGVIVAAGDSGLDMSHCYFIDDKYRPGSLRSLFVGRPPRLFLPNHRKVVQYVLPETATIKWFGNDSDGHGTSVAGSIAGAILNPTTGALSNDDGTGAAPMARLSFFDYSGPTMRGTLYIPRPVDDKVLPFHLGVGARLGAETWTLSTTYAAAYLEDSKAFDAFAWRNPEYLSVVAAGNYGENSGMTSTVVAPATAKNVLAVGATVNHPKNFNASSYNNAIYFKYKTSPTVATSFPIWPALGASRNMWKDALATDLTLKMASPAESACTPLSGLYAGMVVLVDAGASQACSYQTRLTNINATKARAVLFIAPVDGFVDDTDLSLENMPLSPMWGFLDRAQGLAIRDILRSPNNFTTPQVVYRGYPTVNHGIDSVLSFSGFGPLKDGRIKPDVVAPGGKVYSATSGDISDNANDATCSRSSSETEGTSVAAALVAGHLALMRQYFRDGYYPTTVAGDPASLPFEPSGMLIKAAAISGARSLAGGMAASVGRVLGAAPDGFQGWGRLDLSRTLPLGGLTASNFRIQVADNGVIADQQMIFLRGLRATGTGPVFATLVWNDYPASGLSTRDLYNDLDFGFQINQLNVANTTYSRTRIDSVNNVERIELTSLRAGDRITLVVHGRSIKHQLLTGPDAQLPQRWSVFVAGHIYGVLKSPLNPMFSRPQRLLQGVPPGTRMQIVSIQTGGCASAVNGVVTVSNTSCGTATAVFTFEETAVPGSAGGGFVYTVKDSSGRCLRVQGTAAAATITSVTCNATAADQRMALFRTPQLVNGTTNVFIWVPQIFLGTAVDDRRCVRAIRNPADNQTYLNTGTCNEEDFSQNFRLERPPSVPLSPPLPPSPAPPAPSPDQLPDKPWYPYPLVFRTDFYPVNGTPNTLDYDYAYYGDSSTLSNLDIVVSWTANGVFYQTGVDATFQFNSPPGAVHAGDNVDQLVMYEYVYWKMGSTPPATSYDICISWYETETANMRVVLTAFRGYAVISATKVFNTQQPLTTFRCNASAPGYVGSYRMNAGPAPPTPPAAPRPPPPPASYANQSLVFRADWEPISGYTGRENRLVDLDLIVGIATPTSYDELGFYYPDKLGGSYGGDNMLKDVNYEMSYWTSGSASAPPAATYHACVRWYGHKKPLMKVTLSIFAFGSLAKREIRTVDTTLTRDTGCNPQSNGYLGTLDLTSGLNAPPPPPPSGCASPIGASDLFSLYFRTQWFSTQGGSAATLYDWDMVVAWTQGGQPQELSRLNRFVSGAVHAGDNTEMSGVVNGEVAYWPTSLTGVPPAATTYHVCVRWFTAGNLNVTLVVALGPQVVLTTSRVLSSANMVGKYCAPGASGYVGSYTYTPSNSSSGAGVASVGMGSTLGVAGWSTGGPSASTASSSSKEVTDGSGADASSQQPGDLSGGGGSVPEGEPATSTGGSGDGKGGSSNSSGGGKSKALVVVLSTVIGGTALIALTVVAVRWRRSKIRDVRVAPLS